MIRFLFKYKYKIDKIRASSLGRNFHPSINFLCLLYLDTKDELLLWWLFPWLLQRFWIRYLWLWWLWLWICLPLWWIRILCSLLWRWCLWLRRLRTMGLLVSTINSFDSFFPILIYEVSFSYPDIFLKYNVIIFYP